MENQTFKYRWVIETLIVLLLAAYGFIFSSVNVRITNVEAEFDSLNPTLLKIQTDVAGIRTDIQWLKEKNK